MVDEKHSARNLGQACSISMAGPNDIQPAFSPKIIKSSMDAWKINATG